MSKLKTIQFIKNMKLINNCVCGSDKYYVDFWYMVHCFGCDNIRSEAIILKLIDELKAYSL